MSVYAIISTVTVVCVSAQLVNLTPESVPLYAQRGRTIQYEIQPNNQPIPQEYLSTNTFNQRRVRLNAGRSNQGGNRAVDSTSSNQTPSTEVRPDVYNTNLVNGRINGNFPADNNGDTRGVFTRERQTNSDTINTNLNTDQYLTTTNPITNVDQPLTNRPNLANNINEALYNKGREGNVTHQHDMRNPDTNAEVAEFSIKYGPTRNNSNINNNETVRNYPSTPNPYLNTFNGNQDHIGQTDERSDSTKPAEDEDKDDSRNSAAQPRRIYGGTKNSADNELAANNRRNEDEDDRWVWGSTASSVRAKTSTTTVPSVGDRANFVGDKCPTGQVRFNNMCIDTD